MSTVYKVTNPDGTAHIASGGFKYPLPSGKRPGKWVHTEGELAKCGNGVEAYRKDKA